MTEQRPIRLYPIAEHREVWKLTYPPIESVKNGVLIEDMRFIPHDGRARR